MAEQQYPSRKTKPTAATRGKTHPPQFLPSFTGAPEPGFSFFRGAAAGVFSVPYEKTALFLTASDGQDPAAPSGLSDERSRLQSLREEFWPRWPNPGQPKQLETARF